MLKRYDVILFDMDGTVLNSDPMILEAMNILYDKYRDGVRTDPSKIIYFSGPPIRETLKNEFPNLDQQFIFDEFHKVSSSLYATHTFPYEHSKEVLLKLKKEGFRLGIVTNKLHHLTEYALECIHLENIFEYIVGFDDVSKGKPNEEGMNKAMDYFHTSKERTIYIGDNKSDFITATNAGVDCCLVNWGPRVLPKDISPKFKINSYLELEDILYE
jgi:HAD superfamily hydrolase (TIGR01549 family)